jgi:hypothetical protein
MFERCRAWRRKISQKADGTLSLAEWCALQDHLTRCKRCQAAYEADCARQEFLGMHTGTLPSVAARRFDEGVLAALRAPVSETEETQPAGYGILSLRLLAQIVTSGLVAASVTALCLSSALHPAESRENGERGAFSTLQRNEPPIPLESLLQSPSPRAALMWTAPFPSHRRRIVPASSGDEAAPARPANTPPASARPAIPVSMNPQETLAGLPTSG